MIRRPRSVRIATEADIEPLFWMLCRDLEQDNSLGIPVSPTSVLALVQKCCRGEGAIAGVIEANGRIVASTGIMATNPLFSNTWKLEQIWLFSAPWARKGHNYAAQLFRFSLWHKGDMSRKLGYNVPLELSVVSQRRLPAKIRLWGRYGKMIGAVFWAGEDDEHRQQADDHHFDAAQPGVAERLQRPRQQG